MKAKTVTIFTASALLTAGTWLILSPRNPIAQSQAPRPSDAPSEKADSGPSRQTILAALFDAKSADEKLKAAERLHLIPVEDVPAIISGIVADQGRELNFPLHALLLRWASADGRAAMNWAWLTWRDDPDWRTACADIARAWAWKDPEALGKWTLAREIVTAPDDHRSLSLENARASDTPPLESLELPAIMRWIAPRCPELAVQILLERKANSAEDLKLWDGFTDPLQFERAATAFDPALTSIIREEQQSSHLSFGPHQHLRGLLLRWRKVDPVSFAKSAFADLFSPEVAPPVSPPVLQVSSLPTSEREAAVTQSLAALPSDKMGTAVSTIIHDWTEADPQACAAWIFTLDDATLASAACDFVGNRAPAHLDETLAWIDRLPAGARAKSLVRAFDAWTAAHSGEEAALSGAGESLQSRWRDLEALKNTVGATAAP